MSTRDEILVVEDEKSIVGFISTILTANGYDVRSTGSGFDAVMMITSHCPSAVILDLGLPDIDGQKVIRSIRAVCSVPIIVVSARTHERDKVEALDNGADDYVTKPFSTSELLARIRTALRHSKVPSSADSSQSKINYKSGDLFVDKNRRRVFLNGKDVHLTQNEYHILEVLTLNSGRVLTYDYIIKSVWGENACFDKQILRVNMANIRRKIEKNPGAPQYLRTEIGVGYWITENEF